MVNKMGMECMSTLMELKEKDFGNMENVYNGLMSND